MDEGLQGPQYAIQIAVHTLRDRCKHLQQHVALLEEENVNLRIKCSQRQEIKHSLTELDHLRAQVAELTQQKGQLQSKLKLVTNENQDLWSMLSKSTRDNQSLGSQLTKISNTLTQHSAAPCAPQHNLIRSKTFTKSELHTKVQKNLEENDKISLELEDVSLKLSDSFSKQKKELDLLCSEISEMTFSNDALISDKCAFLYDEDLDSDTFSEVQTFGEELKDLKDAVLHQRTLLELSLKNINLMKDKMRCKTCQSKKSKVEKSTSTIDLLRKSYENKSTETDVFMDTSPVIKQVLPAKNGQFSGCSDDGDKICPICAVVFPRDAEFVIFVKHVEEHFIPDMEGFEML
ncbi:protein spindle-F [Euwallacea similis]|uniref:protein spindle-F n=1 Tax=Euwallacea similis TaxID=1736056 RepID=UPI00344EF7F1